jgi:hypothetical protein
MGGLIFYITRLYALCTVHVCKRYLLWMWIYVLFVIDMIFNFLIASHINIKNIYKNKTESYPNVVGVISFLKCSIVDDFR